MKEQEKKVTESNITERNITESNVTELENMEEEIEITKPNIFKLKQKGFMGRDGNVYYGYIVDVVLRGRDMKVDFVPKDKGGYEVLELVFNGKKTVDLYVTEDTMVDSTGKKTRFKVYTARSIDENGEIFEINVKPDKDSDKSIIENVLRNQK